MISIATTVFIFAFGFSTVVSQLSTCVDPACPHIIKPPNYKVYLDNCGRRPTQTAAICAPKVTTAPIVSDPVLLPYSVPKPRTLCNTCKCVKTIVKPQEVQQQITVPVIKKFIQTMARPVYEVINYNAVPVNCPCFESYVPCPIPCGS